MHRKSVLISLAFLIGLIEQRAMDAVNSPPGLVAAVALISEYLHIILGRERGTAIGRDKERDREREIVRNSEQ